MTPVPIELPVKTSDAALLAELIFEHAEGRKINDGIRSRIGARLASLKLAITVQPGSLQRDPVHPSTYYVVADALLLRVALAQSPSSGLFPNSLLIGRLRTASGLEAVVNAIPFGVGDRDQIRRYAENVDREFLPRVLGAVPAVAVYASRADAEAVWNESVWRAILAGWRAGWSAALELEGPLEGRLALDFSRFSVAAGEAALPTHASIARVRRQFDFEIDLRGAAAETTAEEIAETLQSWRALGKPVQFIAPRFDAAPRETFEDRLRLLHDAARQGNALLSFDAPDEWIGKVTGGRVNYRGSAFLRP
jgi:hypothetical protein